jgi:TfdA family taurine catabolism dioxygenase TauD
MIHARNRTATSHAGPTTGAWDARLQRSRIECELSEAAGREIAAALRRVGPASRVVEVAADPGTLPRLRDEIEACRRRVECEERAVLIRAVPGLTFHERRALAWIVANLFGEPLAQNTDGDRLIAVYARPGTKRIAEGARYHQTREGGGVHTDNVNMPDFWEYLVFSCIRPARVGGESILLSGFAVHDELLQVPEALVILRRPFWWEYRGISDDLYQAPIVTYNDAGEPRFRYLRRYLESAHARAGDPLSVEQAWALDTLDAVLDMPHLQFRTKLSEGEILVTYDSQVLHSRTSFADESPGAPASLTEAAAGSCRFFDRVWVRKRPPLGD